jgi:hypothetical protein
MPLNDPVTGLVGDEYNRFIGGWKQLDPDYSAALAQLKGNTGPKAGQPGQIIVPGWDDVIKLPGGVQPTADDFKAYFKSLRDHQPSGLDPATQAAVLRALQRAKQAKASADPLYFQAWGAILTALDNVQDLVSTIASLGRLAIWLFPKIAGRAVPILGPVILLNDLLNIISLIGLLAMPAYALLCGGPRAAMAAGIPAVARGKALKGMSWKSMFANPFSRVGRAKLRAKAAGRLPGIGNLIEIGQTTQALWGWGLSFGAIVGAASATTAATAGIGRGTGYTVNWDNFYTSLGADIGAGRRPDTETLAPPLHQAAAVMVAAPVILGTQDVFSNEEHLAALLAYRGALELVTKALRGTGWQDVMARDGAPAMSLDAVVSPRVRELVTGLGWDLDAGLRWPVPGSPRILPADEWGVLMAGRMEQALGDYYLPRRLTQEGALAGVLINEILEGLMRLVYEDDEAIRWELTTDSRLISSMLESSVWLNAANPPEKLWRFWNAARAALEVSGATGLPESEVWRLAREADVDVIKLLPVDYPYPAEWSDWLQREYPLPDSPLSPS